MTALPSMHSAGGRTRPATLGELRRIPDFDARSASRSVKDEIRSNLLRIVERGEFLDGVGRERIGADLAALADFHLLVKIHR